MFIVYNFFFKSADFTSVNISRCAAAVIFIIINCEQMIGMFIFKMFVGNNQPFVIFINIYFIPDFFSIIKINVCKLKAVFECI